MTTSIEDMAIIQANETIEKKHVAAFETSEKYRFHSRHHHTIVGSGHDLIVNEILVWVLPTNMRMHQIKFTTIFFRSFLHCRIIILSQRQQRRLCHISRSSLLR